MFKIMKMAFKNVWRNKRRTLFTLLMISFGIVVILFVGGFLGSISESVKESVILGETGDIEVMAIGYKEKRLSGTLDYMINDASQLINELMSEADVKAVTQRVAVGGMLGTGKLSVYAAGTSIDLTTVKDTIPNILMETTNGVRDLDLHGQDGVIIGSGVARKLEVGRGDSLVFAAYDKYGSMNAVDVTVTDICQYATDAESDMKIIMNLPNAITLLGLENQVTEICIKVKDRSKVPELVASLENKYGEKYSVKFYAWTDLLGSFGQTIGMFEIVKVLLIVILSIVVLIGVINTVLMSVFERTSEIGTLMALGSSKRRITWMFIAESFWIGLVGSIIGIAIGSVVVSLLAIKGIPFSAPGTTQAFYIKPILQPGTVVVAPVVLLIVSMIAGVYPSRFAAKLNPIDAIRKS